MSTPFLLPFHNVTLHCHGTAKVPRWGFPFSLLRKATMSPETAPAAVVELIRKLLKKTTENGCTEAEAATAFAMASRKLAEHNLTMDEVTADEKGEASWIEEEVEELARWSLEDNLRYGILREFYFVECVLMPRNGRKVFHIFGKPENVQVARFVWHALGSSFERCWMIYKITHKVPASEKRLFLSGMAQGFSEKLRAERRAQVIERDLVRGGGPGTALALTSITAQIQAAFTTHYGKTKKNGGGFAATNGSQSTLDAGVSAGRNLNLNRASTATEGRH